jgi:hypothetical protein
MSAFSVPPHVVIRRIYARHTTPFPTSIVYSVLLREEHRLEVFEEWGFEANVGTEGKGHKRKMQRIFIILLFTRYSEGKKIMRLAVP